MAVVRATNHAIQSGIQTVLSFSDSHKVINFPLQTDQGLYQIPWAVPTLTPEMYPTRSIDRGASGRAAYIGRYRFAWTFDKWTPLMYKYVCDTFLSTDDAWADVTVRAYNQFEEATYLTARMQRPQLLTPIRGAGFQGVKIEFLMGKIIT